LESSGVTANQAGISWTSSSSATSYNIKRSTNGGSGYVVVGIPTGPTYVDTFPSGGTTYYYVVSAVNNGTESANSSQIVITTPPGPGLNLLSNPSSITAAGWYVSGTGAEATAASILSCASNGGASLYQYNVSVSSGTNYAASITVSTASGPNGLATLTVYSTGYASTLATQSMALTDSPQTFEVTFNSGTYSSVVFELDLSPNTAGAVLNVTGSSLNTP